MIVKISDRFYEPYSFAIDFGHGQKQEIENIRQLLRQKGLSGNNNQIKDCLDFVKEISISIRTENSTEIKAINKIIKKEKITGGIIPPDILIGYETYKQIIDLAMYGTWTLGAINKLSGDRIYKNVSKAMKKLWKSKKAKKLIVSRLHKIVNWEKKKTKTIRKKQTNKSKVKRRSRK